MQKLETMYLKQYVERKLLFAVWHIQWYYNTNEYVALHNGSLGNHEYHWGYLRAVKGNLYSKRSFKIREFLTN